MNSLESIKVGEAVYSDGDSGFCQGSAERVAEIKVRYDINTGKPYNVIIIHSNDQEFDSRDGSAITPPLAYSIQKLFP